MKAIYEQISPFESESTYLLRRFSLPRFNVPFHYHPEIELTLIEQSHGKRFVGGHVANFEAGDLVLLGANVPHCWLNDDPNLPTDDAAKAIVIHFDQKVLGDTFLTLPETKSIKGLFQKIQSGLSIKGKTRDIIAEMMAKSFEQPPFKRLLNLLEILHVIAQNPADGDLLDSNFSQNAFSSVENERFKKVYGYLIENFREEISLETVAEIAHLTPTAFCRYFKKITHKTLIDVLTEFRVKHAAQLLTTTDKSVSEVCFGSGFGNISYFNKEFKKATGHTPLTYRKMGRNVFQWTKQHFTL
ncbi:MAG: AraC family transcriptional regulator [Spirosomaceae bacterium]|jgi:AraC-like DNA-binding protein|nr:AraC family transcriptional regulator [Spirosomataceae bacterium]